MRYRTQACIVCGRLISINGVAQASHYAKHIKAGVVRRETRYTRGGQPCRPYYEYHLAKQGEESN